MRVNICLRLTSLTWQGASTGECPKIVEANAEDAAYKDSQILNCGQQQKRIPGQQNERFFLPLFHFMETESRDTAPEKLFFKQSAGGSP